MKYEVGKFYDVPCAYDYQKRLWLPVLGSAHTDHELVPWIPEHRHFDFRFISDHCLRRNWGLPSARIQEAFARVIRADAPVKIRRRRCYREMPAYPFHRKFACKVEALVAGKRLNTKTLICPHRGIPLDGLPVDEEGCVVCPGHGLKWNVQTGELVRREA